MGDCPTHPQPSIDEYPVVLQAAVWSEVMYLEKDGGRGGGVETECAVCMHMIRGSRGCWCALLTAVGTRLFVQEGGNNEMPLVCIHMLASA